MEVSPKCLVMYVSMRYFVMCEIKKQYMLAVCELMCTFAKDSVGPYGLVGNILDSIAAFRMSVIAAVEKRTFTDVIFDVQISQI